MKYFFDRNIAVQLAAMIAAYDDEHEICHHNDDPRFDEKSKDTYIIETLSQDCPLPVFLTCDINIYRKYPDERAALRESGLTTFWFRKTFHNISRYEQAKKLLHAWPSIKECAESCKYPTAFEVTPNGKVNKIGLIEHL